MDPHPAPEPTPPEPRKPWKPQEPPEPGEPRPHDVASLTTPTLSDLDALARLALEAAREGTRLRLSNAGPALRALLDLTGLAEPLGQTEEREPPLGVEEGVEPGDLPA